MKKSVIISSLLLVILLANCVSAITVGDISGNIIVNPISGKATQQQINVKISVGIAAPIISLIYPQQNQVLPFGTSQVNIQILTNKNATCKHSLNSSFNFNEGVLFNTTGKLNHSFLLVGSNTGGTYYLYYKCNDTSGNINPSSIEHIFSIASPQPGGIPSCTESWSCLSWSSCVNGNQTRKCVDLNNCGAIANKPSERQTCTQCIDGTEYNACSFNKPKYCSAGNLIDKCSLCSCSSGQQCFADESCGIVCKDNKDCPKGYECKDQKCLQAEKVCNINADCASGKYCSNGVCQTFKPAPPITLNIPAFGKITIPTIDVPLIGKIDLASLTIASVVLLWAISSILYPLLILPVLNKIQLISLIKNIFIANKK